MAYTLNTRTYGTPGAPLTNVQIDANFQNLYDDIQTRYLTSDVVVAATASKAVLRDTDGSINATIGKFTTLSLTGNATVGGTLTVTSTAILNGNVTVGDASTDTLTINSTITSNLLFTDNTYDIGASGATRPRNLFLGSGLTVGGVATFSAGSASAPSITTSGDTNNGIFFPATDAIAITTAGSERMRVDSSGNLGLGVTPSAWVSGLKAIQVGSNSYPSIVDLNNGVTTWGSNYYNDGGNRFANASSRYSLQFLQDTTAGSQSWRVSNAAGTSGNAITYTTAMTLDASGNVGIGTSSPSYKLDIAAGALGTAAGDQVLLQRFKTTDSNVDYLEVTNTRQIAGSVWNGAGTRLQQKIDSTWMGYIQFNGGGSGTGNDAGISFGTGSSTVSAVNISERMRIDSSGNVGIGGTLLTGNTLTVGKNITGAVNAFGIYQKGVIQSDVTTAAFGLRNDLNTVASAFTLPSYYHVSSTQNTIGAGSIVTNQYGFYASVGLTGATTNYGFYSDIDAPTSGISTTGTITSISSSGTTVTINHNAITYTNGQTVTISATANATALTSGATCTILTVGTTDFTLIGASANTVGTSFTATGAGTGTGTVTLNVQGSGKTVAGAASGSFTYTTTTSQTFTAITVLSGSVTVSTRWNIYADGTANNYLAGSVGIGATGLSDRNLGIAKNITGGTTAFGISQDSVIQSGVTTLAIINQSNPSTAAASFTLTTLTHYRASQNTIGSGSTVTNQYGFEVSSTLTGATNNYGFYSNIASGSNRWNFYAAGTADNYFAGNLVAGSATMAVFNTTATTVNAFGAATTLNIGAATGTSTVNNDLVVSGNLTVNGTTTTINATTITVDDINIQLGSVASPTDVTAAGGGITLKGATDKTITWSAANGWTSSENFNLVTGKTFKINGSDVLSGSSLGTGITGSSLTSVGTITSGTWNASTVTTTGLNSTGNTTLGNASTDTLTVNATVTSNLIFTDNTYDIGASGATRPRNLYLAGNATVAGNVGIGTTSPSATLHVAGTDAVIITKGTTAEQPGSPVTGMLRYNTTTNQFEGYSGSSPAWNPVGGASLSNDTTTASYEYPLFASATSGTATTIYTSNAKYRYKPSTGELEASALVASNGITINSTTVSASYTIATGQNGLSVGPITVNSGITVTVSSGQRWLVL